MFAFHRDHPISIAAIFLTADYFVFHDLGIAFAVVLILIYALLVGWFKSFITPLVIMAAIPFSIVGIMPGHWLMEHFLVLLR